VARAVAITRSGPACCESLTRSPRRFGRKVDARAVGQFWDSAAVTLLGSSASRALRTLPTDDRKRPTSAAEGRLTTYQKVVSCPEADLTSDDDTDRRPIRGVRLQSFEHEPVRS
jgi:hypothetical protein